jgi:hypothetical protein
MLVALIPGVQMMPVALIACAQWMLVAMIFYARSASVELAPLIVDVRLALEGFAPLIVYARIDSLQVGFVRQLATR